MTTPQSTKCKIAASLVLVALLTLASSASATLVITGLNRNGAVPYNPAWTGAADSLIAGLSPSSSAGNFAAEGPARNISTLTAGGSLTISLVGNDNSPNYVTCGNGSGAGSSLIYTLPASANGYDVTNITVYSGWKDNGRDAQAYNVSYSTQANPTSFISLTYVSYNPTVASGVASANRVTLTDSLGAAIATNVAAVKFDFTAPTVENGFTGYGAIVVEGTASATVTAPPIVITTANQHSASAFTPTWTIETDSLIYGQAPSAVWWGNFAYETGVTGTSALTDGTFGIVNNNASYATCGGGSGGRSVTYTLTNSVNGSDLTNIVVYSGWGNNARDGQFYNISYSTVSAPTTFIPLTSIFYNPVVSGISANRVAITTSTGAPLATNVYNVRFDFTPQTGSVDNGYSGYAELILEGTNSAPPPVPPVPYVYVTADTLPASATDVVGGQITFTAAFSNSPAATYQWQVISGAVTNDISGATNTTLTFTNLQLADTGSYQLKAVNATNSQGVSYSTASPLTVSSVPAPVNNIITSYAAQTGLGQVSSVTNFYPASWIIPTNSLIAGATTGAGTLVAGAGNFDVYNLQAGTDPALLTDGSFGYFNYWPTKAGSPTEVTCGSSPGGASVTYPLPTSITGYDLTNIVVYGGWGDNDRNEQKYEVLYSTVAAPSTFYHLVSVDYNPSNPNNAQSATRTTITPATSVLAQNVAAVMFNFAISSGAAKNGQDGYSEIIVSGVPAPPRPFLAQDITPLNASDVVGSQVTIMAAFTSDTPLTYQWQKNGTNIPGATTTPLTLSNLQLTDTATNGGYRLVASNDWGFTISRACALTVNPVPAPVTNVIAAVATQTSDQAIFTPTWTIVSGSLIAEQLPISGGSSTGLGIFYDPSSGLGGLPVLTDESFGSIGVNGPNSCFAQCGPSAGRSVTYPLTGSANGYNLTNIMIASGWNDNGRDQQAYTIRYAMVGNPTTFFPWKSVSYKPVVAAGLRSLVRMTFTPVTGSLATNVAAVMIDFTTPVGENGYSGYDEISLFGFASAPSTAPIVVTTENQNVSGNPTWIIETNSLIAGQLPSSVGSGDFTGSYNTECCGGLPVLTDGTFGPMGIGCSNMDFATCGGTADRAGTSVTYTSVNGWNLTNIVVYSGWGNYDRDGQFYNISYSTLSAPTTFIPLVSVTYNPPWLPAGSGGSANRVGIAPSNGGTLATNVAAVKFDFTPQVTALDGGYSGYAEIVLQGSNLAPAIPPTVGSPTVLGGNLILTGTGGTPGRSYTWLTTTNLLTPMANWTTSTTGVLDGSGAFSNAIPINYSNKPASFFRLRIP